MVNDNAALQSGIAIANSPRSQETKKPRAVVTLGRQAQSVTREPSSRWLWWLEVNPIDGEVCAQPWTNTGLVDIEHAEERRMLSSGERRHLCTPCQVTYSGGDVCWVCGQPPDDDWYGTKRVNPGVDSGIRRLA